jgi:small subunit ribosomal protein S21
MSVQIYAHPDDFEQTIMSFKKMILKDGILKELKLRSRFESRSQRRKRKSAEAMRRMKRKLTRNEQFVSQRRKTQQDYVREKKEVEMA